MSKEDVNKNSTSVDVGKQHVNNPQQQPAGEGELTVRHITDRERFQAILDPPMAHWLSNSGADEKTIASMYDQLDYLIARRLSAMLEKILANGSGGGNWRRLLVEEIDRLKRKDAG